MFNYSLAEDTKVVCPKPKFTRHTSEKGTNPLFIETRSHSVQTRLSSIPSPQITGTVPTSSNSAASGQETSLILHRVIVDPSAKKSSPEGGLTAILPLLKQCTRCGSQRVRLVLVERPPASASRTLPIPSPIPSQTPVVSTPTIHRQHHHDHGKSRPVFSTLPKKSERKRKEPRILRPEQQARQQMWMDERSMMQPISLPSSQYSLREKPQRAAVATAVKSLEKTSRVGSSRGTCSHRHQPRDATPQIPSPKLHSNTPRHRHQHHGPLEGMSSSGSRGHSLPRDPRPSPRQQPFRHEHHHHHFHHNKPTSAIIKSSSQDTPSTSHQWWITPITTKTKSFQNVPVKQRPSRRGKQKVGPPEPRLEGDGAAAPSSSSLKGGTLIGLPHSHIQPRQRHLLSPPAMESQPIPPALLMPHSRRSLTTPSTTYIPPASSATTPISFSQPMLAQTSTSTGRQPRRTYDEVDYLLYNLCLNIESAL
ncbi:unnamed protein product [Rodentolepis nana]|uniref:Ras-GEF domain-containing protein n=1 Tax=Rodentolepis nana TaxID=102285 RepID=A0A0R3TUA1_RODNA|nr:unnamed protein product [Rodentolepis nana]